MEKIWQPHACITERLGEMSLLPSGYKRYIPTFNTTTYITRAGDSAKKCSSVLATPNMVVVHGRLHISFMLIQKTKYYVINQECQLLFFRICEISGAEHLLGKQFSALEISRNLSKSLPCYLFVFTMSFNNQCFIISTQRVHNLCPQAIYKYIYFILTGYEISFS